jgi:hypothetical protein
MVFWLIVRFACSTHLILSIPLVLATKSTRPLFFLPIIGLGLIVIETLVSTSLNFRFQSLSIILLVYSIFTIVSIWLLKLYRIAHLLDVANTKASVEVF